VFTALLCGFQEDTNHMPRWDQNTHPKYQTIEMHIIRRYLKSKCGIDTSTIGDQEFLDRMKELQDGFDAVRSARHLIDKSLAGISPLFPPSA
jgi:hypothetical protein